MSIKSNARRDAWRAGKGAGKGITTGMALADSFASSRIPQALAMPDDVISYRETAHEMNHARQAFYDSLDTRWMVCPVFCGETVRDEHGKLIYDPVLDVAGAPQIDASTGMPRMLPRWRLKTAHHARIWQEYRDRSALQQGILVDGVWFFDPSSLIASAESYVKLIEDAKDLASVVALAMRFVGRKAQSDDVYGLGGYAQSTDPRKRMIGSVWTSLVGLTGAMDALKRAGKPNRNETQENTYQDARKHAMTCVAGFITAWITLHPSDAPHMPSPDDILIAMTFAPTSASEQIAPVVAQALARLLKPDSLPALAMVAGCDMTDIPNPDAHPDAASYLTALQTWIKAGKTGAIRDQRRAVCGKVVKSLIAHVKLASAGKGA